MDSSSPTPEESNPFPQEMYSPPDWFRKYFWKLLSIVLFMLVTALQTWIILKSGIKPVPIPGPLADNTKESVKIVGQDTPPPNAFGWVNDGDEVRKVKAALPIPVFADTPAGKNVEVLPNQVYLWESYRKLFDRNPPTHDQNPIGSCVSFGSSRAYERTLAAQIVQGDMFEFKDLCEESIYALSRVEIGGGRIRGDGSVGAWAAKGFTDYGGLPRGIYGRHNLTAYDPIRCRSWGNSGLPDELEPEVKKFPAGDCSQIRTWEEAKRALAQGYGVFVCSDQGFTRQRDSNGVCRASGQWMHCMSLDGYHKDGSREYGHIENSWGSDYHIGPTGWGDPNTAGFWADSTVINRMLSQGDSWAVSAVKGFPNRKLDWLVKQNLPNLQGVRYAKLYNPLRVNSGYDCSLAP